MYEFKSPDSRLAKHSFAAALSDQTNNLYSEIVHEERLRSYCCLIFFLFVSVLAVLHIVFILKSEGIQTRECEVGNQDV